MSDSVWIETLRTVVLIQGKPVYNEKITLPCLIRGIQTDMPRKSLRRFDSSRPQQEHSQSEADLPTLLVSIGDPGSLDLRMYAGCSQPRRSFAGRQLSFRCHETIAFSAPSPLCTIREPADWRQKKEVDGKPQEGVGIGGSAFYYPVDATTIDESGRTTGVLLQLGPRGYSSKPQTSSRHWHTKEVEHHFRLIGSLRLGTGEEKDNLTWEPLERHVVTPGTWHQVEKDPKEWSVTLIIIENLQATDVRQLNHNRE